MLHNQHGRITRRALLKAGAALPLVGVAAPNVLSQPLSKSPTTVLDFKTNADVAKAEQEGQLVFYCHENEAGTAGIMQGFSKDFPKIKTSYVRAQTACAVGCGRNCPTRRMFKSPCEIPQPSPYPSMRSPSDDTRSTYSCFRFPKIRVR